MTRIAMPLLVLALLVTAPARLSAQTVDAITRTFPVPIERAWVVAESVLKGLGWEIDKSDRAVGWILTDSRGLEFKDFAVYGEGTRHKLRLVLKAAGEGRTSVSVETGGLQGRAHPLDDGPQARKGHRQCRGDRRARRHPEEPPLDRMKRHPQFDVVA